MSLWALKWSSENRLDGKREHLIHEHGMPRLFTTRRESRDYAEFHFGYIRKRPDLLAEPHGWSVPQPVRVAVIETAAE